MCKTFTFIALTFIVTPSCASVGRPPRLIEQERQQKFQTDLNELRRDIEAYNPLQEVHASPLPITDESELAQFILESVAANLFIEKVRLNTISGALSTKHPFIRLKKYLGPSMNALSLSDKNFHEDKSGLRLIADIENTVTVVTFTQIPPHTKEITLTAAQEYMVKILATIATNRYIASEPELSRITALAIIDVMQEYHAKKNPEEHKEPHPYYRQFFNSHASIELIKDIQMVLRTT